MTPNASGRISGTRPRIATQVLGLDPSSALPYVAHGPDRQEHRSD